MKQRNTICVYDLSLQTKQRNPLKKKRKFQQQKKKAKKSLCLILGQNKKKEPLPIFFFKELVQAQTLIWKFQSHPPVITHCQTPLNP